MYLRQNNPPFKPRLKKGEFPYNLTFGFEAEIDSQSDWNDDWTEDGKEAKAVRYLRKIQRRYDNFMFYKEEWSVSNGLELTTHPFNWNWIQQNKKIISSIDSLKKYGFKGSRDCGFHVHINRKFFTKKHLEKMAKLFYFNHKFIKKVSKRNNMEYCSSTVFNKWRNNWNLEKYPPTPEEITEIPVSMWYEWAKSVALNLYPRKTIEVRIFQGTCSKELIWAYLEFTLGCVMFTKQTSFEKVTPRNLLAYMKKYPSTYENAIKLTTRPQSMRY